MKKAEKVFNGQVKVPNIEIEYRGFTIKPKLDFTCPHSNVNTYLKGYVVVQNGYNVMPGATWAASVIEARVMIDVFIEVNKDGEMFWEKMRELQGRKEYVEV